MTIRVETKIFGLEELDQALRDLRKQMSDRGQAGAEGNIVKNALTYTARKNVQERMRALVPEDTGRLKRSIFQKVERNPRVLSEVVYVGPRLGKSRDDPNGAWYAAIVNFKGGKGGRGRHFMQRSIKPNEDSVLIGKRIGAGIERAAKKIGAENLRKVGARAKAQFK